MLVTKLVTKLVAGQCSSSYFPWVEVADAHAERGADRALVIPQVALDGDSPRWSLHWEWARVRLRLEHRLELRSGAPERDASWRGLPRLRRHDRCALGQAPPRRRW